MVPLVLLLLVSQGASGAACTCVPGCLWCCLYLCPRVPLVLLILVSQGANPDVDSYSAFFDNKKLSKTSLEDILKKEDVTDLYICGIATDVCVGNTFTFTSDF